MNGHIVSDMAEGASRPLVSTGIASRSMSSTICYLDSGPLMALLIATLRDGLGQQPGVSTIVIVTGLSGFSLHFPIAPS
jgi:hypothetical protein